MANKTHWKKVVSDPNFIGEGDFQEGEEKVLTIDRVNAAETVTTAEGKSKKAVLHWREPGNKPMILNVARSKNIEKVAGSGYFEDWPGVQVQLYIEHGIKAFGEVVSAVRVRPFKPRAQQQAPIPPCTDCKQPIEAAMGKSAAYMAQYTTKNYGVPLCAECAQKRKNAQKGSDEAEPEEAKGAVPEAAESPAENPGVPETAAPEAGVSEPSTPDTVNGGIL